MKKKKKSEKEDSVLIKMSKMRKFEEILKLGQVSASALGIKMFQKEVAKLVRKILQCKYFYLYLFDAKGNCLIREMWTKDGKVQRVVKCKIDPSTFVGTCAYECNMLNLVDFSYDIRAARMDEFLKSIECHSFLLSPLMLKGELIGVVKAINSNKRQFDDEDEFFMEAVSNQISIVLHNFHLVEGLQKQFLQTVHAMADAIGKKDSYTGGHTKRVECFVEMIAKEMGITYAEKVDLRLAAVLHDIGKIGIEDKILKKTSPLTDEEFRIMKKHPEIGYEILGHIDGLGKVVDGMRFHHERPDGTGYPYGLKGKEIPVIASIIAVADAFDAMISTRPYSKGCSPMDAYKEILNNRGTQFDEDVVDAFVKGMKKTKMYKIEQLEEKKVA